MPARLLRRQPQLFRLPPPFPHPELRTANREPHPANFAGGGAAPRGLVPALRQTVALLRQNWLYSASATVLSQCNKRFALAAGGAGGVLGCTA